MGPRLRGDDTAELTATSSLARHDVGPQGVELIGLEEIAPGRHLVLAASDRVDEALALVGREFAQVEGGAGIEHARAVAGRAVGGVELGTGLDSLLRKAWRFLCRRWHADQQGCQPNDDRSCSAAHVTSVSVLKTHYGRDKARPECSVATKCFAVSPAGSRRSRPSRPAAPCP